MVWEGYASRHLLSIGRIEAYSAARCRGSTSRSGFPAAIIAVADGFIDGLQTLSLRRCVTTAGCGGGNRPSGFAIFTSVPFILTAVRAPPVRRALDRKAPRCGASFNDRDMMEGEEMRTIPKVMVSVALAFGLTSAAGQALAEPAFVVPQGPPVWCFGLNEFDQCVLYLGTAETCQNLRPCSAPNLGIPITGLTLCFGADEVTGECRLFFGTEETCNSLEPCRAVIGQLPRSPRLVEPR